MSKADEYESFFKKVLVNLRKHRLGVDWKVIDHAPNWNWIAVNRVKHDVWYGIGFTKDKRLRVDLHLGHRSREESQRLFNELYEHKQIIELALGFTLSWESPKMLRTQAGRLATYRDGEIEDRTQLGELIDWAVDMIVSIRTALTGYLQEL